MESLPVSRMEDNKLKTLRFMPFTSKPEVGFWFKLVETKLNHLKLDKTPMKIRGIVAHTVADSTSSSGPVVTVDQDSFKCDVPAPPFHLNAPGTLVNVNTFEEFKGIDKKQLLQDAAQELWNDMTSGKCISNTEELLRFFVISFANLKKYEFYYWFCFPSFILPQQCTLLDSPRQLSQSFADKEIEMISASLEGHRAFKGLAFWLCIDDGSVTIHSLEDAVQLFTDDKCGKVILVIKETSSSVEHPAWPLRNLLTMITLHWGKYLQAGLKVLCWQESLKPKVELQPGEMNRSLKECLVLHVELPTVLNNSDWKPVGWEKSVRRGEHVLIPRRIDLSSTMDPQRLASSAAELNLRLMRWRLMPEIDLEAISSQRCLLIGSGTLGCNVARQLMAWGVKHISLVDNGRVSYSNPVRQTLFEFNDCIAPGGPKSKCQAAADALIRILPSVNAHAHLLSIPMPGHEVPKGAESDVRDTIRTLHKLISDHDIIFLLTDTRESRWLPTVQATALGKLVFTAALGFDSYLVMRHGFRGPCPQTSQTASADSQKTKTSSASSCVSGAELGCYFCNDVVAPGNSMRDRTLDQQCTVSRPGVSMLASALLVELMAALLQHPLRGCAEADAPSDRSYADLPSQSCLGLIPHQIRGYTSQFINMLLSTKAFTQCIGCSQFVLDRYLQEGDEFVLAVCNNPQLLEQSAGLDKLYESTTDTQIDWSDSSETSLS